MYYNWKEADDLTVAQMEAADFANEVNDMHTHGEDAFPTVDAAIDEHVGLIFDTQEEARAAYETGQEVLKRYAIFHGARSTIPYLVDGKPSDSKVANADAWFLVDAGHIATSPAYRFVRFYRRKEQAAQTTI